MTKTLLTRHALAVVLIGLVAGLIGTPSAEAVTKAARARAAKVRASRALKKPPRNVTPKAAFSNLQAIGIVGRDVGNGGGCFVRGVSGRAQTAGIDPGDVIIQVENTATSNTFDADNLVGQAIANGFPDVVIWVIDKNTGGTVGVLVPLG